MNIIFQFGHFNGCGCIYGCCIFDKLLVVVSFELEFMLEVFDVADEFVGRGAFVGCLLIAGHRVVGCLRSSGFDGWWRVGVVVDLGIFVESHGLIVEVRFSWCCHCDEELSADFVYCWSCFGGWFVDGVDGEEGRC